MIELQEQQTRESSEPNTFDTDPTNFWLEWTGSEYAPGTNIAQLEKEKSELLEHFGTEEAAAKYPVPPQSEAQQSSLDNLQE